MAGSIGPWGRRNKVMIDAATERAEKAASMYRRGLTFAAIAKKLEVCTKTVERDIERARKVWREQAGRSYQTHLDEQLAKIDEAEAAAWQGWEKSTRDELVTGTEEADTPKGSLTKTKIQRRNQSGSATFIQTIERLISLRCRLLGLLDKSPEAEGNANGDGAQIISIVVGSREEASTLKMLTVSEYQAKLAESTGAAN